MPAARVERWFLRVMLGVSVVAWLALLLAELGQFRLGLLGFLLAIGAFGLTLLVYAFRASPATPTAAAGWLNACAGSNGGDPAVRRAVPPAVRDRGERRRRHRLSQLRPSDCPPWRARVRGCPAAPAVDCQPRGAVPESGARRRGVDGARCSGRAAVFAVPRRLPDPGHRRPDGHRRLFPAVSGPDRPGPRPRLAAGPRSSSHPSSRP